MSSIKKITHFINGETWSGSSERSGDVFNPATGLVTAQVDFASVSVVDHAVEVAFNAQKEWRSTSLAKDLRFSSLSAKF